MNTLRLFRIFANVIAVGLCSNAIAQTTYIHTDYLGSVIAESNSSGTITERYYFEPFGERIGQASGEEPAYTGHVFDADLNLSYMQQRFYDPVVGRFYSDDPIAFQSKDPASFNRYLYARGNPYKYIDPDGMYADLAIEAVSIGIGLDSLVTNARSGNYGAAAVDGIGIFIDVLLAALPGAPGAAGITIAGVRESAEVASKTRKARKTSRAKRRAAREAQRRHGTPTSKAGTNQQQRAGTPRHQIKEGSSGQDVGVVDGSKDRVPGHGSHVEVGNVKSSEPTNRHGQPRIVNDKVKVDYQ